jgi:hypothetical protein
MSKRSIADLRSEPFNGTFEVAIQGIPAGDGFEDCLKLEVVEKRGVMVRFESGRLIGRRREALALAIESGIVGRTAFLSRKDSEALLHMTRAIGKSYQLPFAEFIPVEPVSRTTMPTEFNLELPGVIADKYVDETLALIKMYPSGDKAGTLVSMFPPCVVFTNVPSPMIGLDSFRVHITTILNRRRNQETVTALVHAVREGIPFRLNTNHTMPTKAGE